MMRKPNNWENVQAFSENKALPLGAYVCKIQSAKVEENQHGSQLLIAFDIEEGEQKGYYKKQFDASTLPDKKWKGVIRQWLPLENGEERDEITKRSLKGLVNAIENSNPGFVFNWDEKSLAGKLVGILFRNEEYEFNGKRGWTVRPFRAIHADRVRSGDFTLPDDKPLRSDAAEPSYTPAYTAPKAPVQQSMNSFTAVEDDDLPF